MRYFIEMSYKGTAYHGWQKQDNALTVQQVLESALGKLLREQVDVTGAGRTDTGVHASYYVAHFDTVAGCGEDTASFAYHLNSILPHDIAVRRVVPVAERAHARFDATMREYKYFITRCKDPFRTDLAWHFRGDLDVRAMNEAAAALLRHDDFTTFCKLHSDNKTNICNVTHALWQEGPDGALVFTIRSDRFLRNMVRAVTGTLTDVGKGKITPERFGQILAARELSLAGNTAPAQGLFLSDVRYPDHIFTRT